VTSRVPPSTPRLLTIAGSDSGGGAGIQADLKTFAAHGGYGMSVVTAVTAQNTVSVTAVAEIPPDMVAAQIDAVMEDLGADAIKIGMLASATLVRTVAERLRIHGVGRGSGGPPVVLDPVMVAQSGATLLADDAVGALRDELVPLATVTTPNLPELERLTGFPVGTEEERIAAARVLSGETGGAVLAKGGHDLTGHEVVDLLVIGGPPGAAVHRFAHPRVDTTSTHGTGCTLSSAIAARLGRGEPLPAAVGGAIGYLQGALEAAQPLGHGHGPVAHFHELFGD
jgi:hydroxymethylpyrimidine/phosphomethylpyrimidine kinase